MNAFSHLLSSSLLCLLPSLTGQADDIHYRVLNQVLHPIDARLFGSFMERPSWDGETGPEGALAPGTHQLQPGVVKLLREMQIPIVRFPGGTDVDFTNWRDMISNAPGRGAVRPVTTGHKNDKVTNNFGYDEFLQLRQDLGWEAILVVNFRDGLLKVKTLDEAARQAAGLVAYCNAPVGAKLPAGMTDWPSIRAQNGHPAPYNVKRWQIGNETWAFHKEVARLAPDNPDSYYADCVLAYVRAMLAVDPSLEFIVDGGKGGELARQQMPQQIRHLVFHSYMPWAIKEAFRNGEPVPIETLSVAEIWRAWVATPGFNQQGLSEFHNKLISQARQRGTKVAVTEWNWNGWWQSRGAALDSLFARGVGAAGFVHALMRAGDVIEIGCQSMLVGHAWEGIHAIKVDPAGKVEPYFIPSGQVMALYAAHHGSRLLALEATGVPTYEQPLKLGGIDSNPKVAYLDALATADDQTVYFHVINRHFDQAMALTLDTTACGPLAKWARLFVLEGRLENRDGPGESAQISHITQSVVPGGSAVTLRVPARSISCLEMPRRQMREK
jgi:alpha-N-arabinofuranosidase